MAFSWKIVGKYLYWTYVELFHISSFIDFCRLIVKPRIIARALHS